MLNDLDNFYLEQEEPAKSCFQALRIAILKFNPEITEAWKYRMPFFCLNGKMFCYLWLEKKTQQPYLGIADGKSIEHEKLIAEKRSRMKILLINPLEDLPLDDINNILEQAFRFAIQKRLK